jgi:hypothetical protein
MLVARYFLYVGGVLAALLFVIDALVPQEAAVANHSAPGLDKSTVRIRSVEKLPEKVVYDTSLPTIVPPAPVTQFAAAQPPAPSLAQASRVRDTFAQFDPNGARQETAKQAEAVPPPKKRKVARTRSIQPQFVPSPYAQPPYAQQPMRIAQQPRFGFFGGGPVWRSTW